MTDGPAEQQAAAGLCGVGSRSVKVSEPHGSEVGDRGARGDEDDSDVDVDTRASPHGRLRDTKLGGDFAP